MNEPRVVDTYARAAELARIAMGPQQAWKDPLAHWCLTEAIVSFGSAGTAAYYQRRLRTLNTTDQGK